MGLGTPKTQILGSEMQVKMAFFQFFIAIFDGFKILPSKYQIPYQRNTMAGLVSLYIRFLHGIVSLLWSSEMKNFSDVYQTTYTIIILWLLL